MMPTSSFRSAEPSLAAGPAETALASAPTTFRQLALSGGGTRCFWQAGFLAAVRDEMGLEPERISCVSGGAMVACGFVARLGIEVLRLTKISFRHGRNIHWPTSRWGFMPHEEAYGRIVKSVFDDGATERVENGPPIEVTLTELPAFMPDALAASLSLATYLVERAVKDATEKTWTRKLGLRPLVVDARQAAAEGRLGELITTASRIPPIFRFECWNDRPVIDGGSMSDAPMPSEEAGATLCLLASYFTHLPYKEGRIFVMPSRTIPTGKIDLTESKEIQEAWDLGVEDGERFLEIWRQGPMDWRRPYKIGDPDWRGRRWRPDGAAASVEA